MTTCPHCGKEIPSEQVDYTPVTFLWLHGEPVQIADRQAVYHDETRHNRVFEIVGVRTREVKDAVQK